MVKGIRLLLRGKVQEVGFRKYVFMHADLLNIKGYVRNLPDGTVEVVYIPTDPKKQEEFEKKVKRGPLLSRVDSVERTEVILKEEPEGFEIRFSPRSSQG